MGPGPTSTAPPAMAAMTSSASPWRPILEPPPRLHSSSSGLATPPRSCEARRQHLPPPTPPVRAEAAARHRAVAVPVHPHRTASPLHLSRRDLGGKRSPQPGAPRRSPSASSDGTETSAHALQSRTARASAAAGGRRRRREGFSDLAPVVFIILFTIECALIKLQITP